MAIGNPNGIPFCWEPPVKTASDIESSPNLRISADGGVSEFSNGCLDGRVFSLVQASPVGVLPSLLVVPQSYKSGKLYAQLPNARVNHIPNNSMFGASGGVLPSGWTFSIGAASGVSLGYSASGQVTAEDGTLVDYIDFTFSGTATASGFLNLRPNASPSTIASVSGQSWNTSVYLQLISGSVASISPTYQLQETTSGGTFIDGSNITGLGLLATSLPLRRYNVTRDLNTSGTVVTCRWGHSIVSGTSYNYTLRIASPQLENLSSPTSVIRTVSGAVYAPYSGEAVRTNLALQSEDFTTTWMPTNTTVSGNVTGTTDPAGGNTADQIFETAVSGIHFLAQTMAIVSGTTYAGSVFLKKAAGSPDWMQVVFSTTGLAGFSNFNLTSGTVGLTGAGCTGRIDNYGNGWYRCTLIQTATASGTSGGPIIVFTNNTNPNTRFVNYTGNTSTSIYAWGAQLETGSSATPYIRTTTAPASFPVASIADFTVSRNTTATRVNSSGLIESVASGVPRIDWLGQSCPALLVEASGTNQIRNNSMVGANVSTNALPTNWLTTLNGLSRQIIAIGTESGIDYIDIKLSGTANNTVATIAPESSTQIVAASGQTWTNSVYIKIISQPSPPSSYSLAFREGTSGGSFVNSGSSAITPTTTLQRLSATRTLTGATTERVQPQINFALVSGSTYDFTVRIGWPQMEQSSFATSVIPTTVAAVSRAADVISASGALVSGLIGQTEGTIYIEYNMQTLGVEGYAIRLVAASFDNSVHIRRNTANLVTLELRSLGSGVFSQTFSATGFVKAAIAYKSGDIAAFVNGTQAGSTSTSAFTFSASFTSVNLGTFGAAAFLNDRIRAAALYTTRLSNDQLAELTRL